MSEAFCTPERQSLLPAECSLVEHLPLGIFYSCSANVLASPTNQRQCCMQHHWLEVQSGHEKVLLFGSRHAAWPAVIRLLPGVQHAHSATLSMCCVALRLAT